MLKHQLSLPLNLSLKREADVQNTIWCPTCTQKMLPVFNYF